MSVAIPTSEPTEATAGYSVQWDKTLSDYPPASYNLVYTLAPLAGGPVTTITPTESGSTYQVRVTPEQSGAWSPGTYILTGYVTDGTDLFDVYHERLEVLAGPASTEDRRSFAQKMVDQLAETYKALAGNSISQASVNGKTYTKRDMEAVRREIVYWENQVRNETGAGSTRRIKVHFNATTD